MGTITSGQILPTFERRGGIGQFTDEVVLRPGVREMMAKVTPYLHEGFEAMGFQRIRSVVEVTLKDGTQLSQEAYTSRGTFSKGD